MGSFAVAGEGRCQCPEEEDDRFVPREKKTIMLVPAGVLRYYVCTGCNRFWSDKKEE